MNLSMYFKELTQNKENRRVELIKKSGKNVIKIMRFPHSTFRTTF